MDIRDVVDQAVRIVDALESLAALGLLADAVLPSIRGRRRSSASCVEEVVLLELTAPGPFDRREHPLGVRGLPQQEVTPASVAVIAE